MSLLLSVGQPRCRVVDISDIYGVVGHVDVRVSISTAVGVNQTVWMVGSRANSNREEEFDGAAFGLLQGRRSDGHSSKNVASRIPKFTFDPERVSDARRCHGDYIRTNFAEDKLYGYRRIPTPMPRGKAPPGGDARR
ncbi:hypothetical protein CEXT_285541 [Caerostris extrusa]|uniref:Uncharacterized protein n=1 Tax=Caerostris extrusa TaxID=172846 RepID=A0AAV4VBK2_CAEEX|nr:hypothetical protein CEXT_285541 [Caerostris extrusa]